MSLDSVTVRLARTVENSRRTAALALVAAVLAPVALANSYQINVLVLVLVFVLLALSVDLLLGFTGYLSLAHHGLWGVGAYTSAVLAVKADVPVLLAMLVATGFTAVFAAAVAVPTFRVRGHYFALATLAVGELVVLVLNNWVEVTEGPFGLTGIPAPRVPLVGTVESRLLYYYATLLVLVGVVAGVVRLLRSPFGLCLRAIREDEGLAEAQGLRLARYKVSAYALSGLIAGIAGALFAHYQQVLGPDNFAIQYMAETLVMVIVGGSGFVAGSVVGPLVFVTLPELYRALGELRLVLFGAVLVVVVIRAPEGIVGLVREWTRRTVRGRRDAFDPDESVPERTKRRTETDGSGDENRRDRT